MINTEYEPKGKEFDGITLLGQRTIFVRDTRVNSTPEAFDENDALAIVTCPDVNKAAIRARKNSWQDYWCGGCSRVAVQWQPFFQTMEVSGKCPRV